MIVKCRNVELVIVECGDACGNAERSKMKWLNVECARLRFGIFDCRTQERSKRRRMCLRSGRLDRYGTVKNDKS